MQIVHFKNIVYPAMALAFSVARADANDDLCLAVVNDNPAVIARLLDKGADLALRNQQNLYAAEFARLGGRETLTRRLTEAGAGR